MVDGLVRVTSLLILSSVAALGSTASAQVSTKPGVSGPEVVVPAMFRLLDAATIRLALWFVFVSLLLILYRSKIKRVVDAVERRLRLGAPFKVGWLELGASYVNPRQPHIGHSSLMTRTDKDKTFKREHDRIYNGAKQVFIAHRIVPSKVEGQLYDVILYLVPHTSSLVNIDRVEYYFGPSWGRRSRFWGDWETYVFTSCDRGRAFPVTTSAWGAFLCVARLFFNEADDRGRQKSEWVYRFVDFEMGAVGPDESTERLESDKASHGDGEARDLRTVRRRRSC